MEKLTHVNEHGRLDMVDVGYKKPQRRTASATGSIRLSASALKLVRENRVRKGDVLAAAQVAGIQAAKQAAALIPLCHPIALDKIDVEMSITRQGITACSEVRCTGRTGAEMEALTAVGAALLTVYDMCKAVDKNMQIDGIKLMGKAKEDVE